ncbi:MAG TPA: GyrI-like domain-containing protein, partial [Methanoregulaceae archaeon]|nr:GyrI-like domain-containing protein [Methanoregulaceae archaeon]
IGRFSQITRLSRKALRLYDDRGILVPEVKELCTGYRYYTGPQIARGVSIKTLCGLGFSLPEITALLAAKDSHDTRTIRELFGERRAKIRSEVHRLQQIEAILNDEDAPLELIYMSPDNPVIKEIPPQRVVGKQGQGSYGETITRLMGDLCRQIFSPENQRNGLKVVGPFMTLYYDSDYREKDATIECAAPVTGRISLTDPAMEVRTIPGGTFLTLLFKGPHMGLHSAWTRIGAYAEEHGYIPTGPHREVYLSDPNEVAEEELLTELQIPVAPQSP